MKTLTKICLLLLVLLSACKKEDLGDPFPPHTEVGVNTFYFRVNGTLYEAMVGYLPTSPRIGVYYSHIDTIFLKDYHFSISAARILGEDNKELNITIRTMPVAGSYNLGVQLPMGESNYAYYWDVKPIEKYYFTDSDNTGVLNITKLDTVNHIIAGKFKFRAKRWLHNQESNEVVTVDGQFDVKYKPNTKVNYY